jgi:hypothetical protein
VAPKQQAHHAQALCFSFSFSFCCIFIFIRFAFWSVAGEILIFRGTATDEISGHVGSSIGIGSIGMGTADDAARVCMIGRASCVLPLHARSAWRRDGRE